MTPADVQRAEAAVRQTLANAERAMLATSADPAASQRLAQLLAEADAELGRRLARAQGALGGPTSAFGVASARAYRSQIQIVADGVQQRVRGASTDAIRASWRSGARQSILDLAELESAFTGISRAPRLLEAMRFDPSRGRASSVLRSMETSLDRYGASMIAEFEQRMALGFASGLSQREMVEMLTGHGGPRGEVSLRARLEGDRVVRTMTATIPEGLFTRYRSWAWRIVRTEASNAYNSAKIEALSELQESIPELQKKILAHFDNRTASDSVAVHGQIRSISGADRFFVDGAGRVYEHPPARPNDRETVIPWNPGWPDVPSTRQLTPDQAEQVNQRIARGEPAIDPVAQREADLAAEGVPTAAQPARTPRTPRAPAPTPAPVVPHEPSYGPGMTRADFDSLRDRMTEQPPRAKSRRLRTSDGGRAVRAEVNAIVRARAPELGSVDQALQPRANQLSIKALRGAHADHGWSGDVRVTQHVADVTVADLARLADGQYIESTHGIRTVLHEELHGISPLTNLRGGHGGYTGLGVWAEEVCVESSARRIVADLETDAIAARTGEDRAPLRARRQVGHAFGGGYQWVFRETTGVMRAAIADAAATDAQMLEVLQEAVAPTWSELRGSSEFAAALPNYVGDATRDTHPGKMYFDAFARNIEVGIRRRFPRVTESQLRELRSSLLGVARRKCRPA